jgi:hypothetical protein
VLLGVVEHDVGVCEEGAESASRTSRHLARDLKLTEASVGVKERLLEAEDDDTRRRGIDPHGGVANTIGDEGKVDVPMRLRHANGVLNLSMKPHATEELSPGASDAVEEKRGGGGDRDVNARLDRGENGGDDGGDPNETLER